MAGGHQPMSSCDDEIWITFNGEIFNHCELREQLVEKGHRFATRSDTEVILHQYQEEGEDCVHRFNGQWAFAIWDLRRQKLFLSRDRLGVRPLFYTFTDHRFIFSSEIKAIFSCTEVRRDLDLRALDQICTFWVTLPPRTIFKNIFQLPPGHSLTLHDGQVDIRKYWTPDYPPVHELMQNLPAQKTEELLQLMVDAVRLRLRADVPVGSYLSGGIDSTFITAITARILQDEVKTFSLGFEDPEFDESHYQKQVSVFLNTQHQQRRCSSEEIGEVLPAVVWHAEQPIVRTAPAPLYLLSKLVNQSGIKVVLTGEGADEILGGYDIFKEAKIRRFWGREPSSRVRPLLLKVLYPYMKNLQNEPPTYLTKFFQVTAEDLASPFFSHLPRWRVTAKLKLFFSDALRSELEDYDPYEELRQALPDSYMRWHPFCQAQYLEIMYLMPGYILSSQGDRMTMAHSVEARYPFLDHRVVEFAAKLHPSLKMRALNEKYLLKRASRGMVPPTIIARTKQPYRAPDANSLMSHGLMPHIRDVLSPEGIRRAGLFDAGAAASLQQKFRDGRAIGTSDNMALTTILSTQLLVDQFINERV